MIHDSIDRDMQDVIDRAKKEKDDLDEKIDKLFNFIHSDAFLFLPTEVRLLLRKQDSVMRDYSFFLREQIRILEGD